MNEFRNIQAARILAMYGVEPTANTLVKSEEVKTEPTFEQLEALKKEETIVKGDDDTSGDVGDGGDVEESEDDKLKKAKDADEKKAEKDEAKEFEDKK